MNTNNPKNQNTNKSKGWVILLGFVLAILVLMYFMPTGNKGQYISITGAQIEVSGEQEQGDKKYTYNGYSNRI